MTKKQASVLEFIRKFIQEHGYSPNLVEIGQAVGSFSGNVHVVVKQLDERGYLRKGRGWRNIRLIDGGGSVVAA